MHFVEFSGPWSRGNFIFVIKSVFSNDDINKSHTYIPRARTWNKTIDQQELFACVTYLYIILTKSPTIFLEFSIPLEQLPFSLFSLVNIRRFFRIVSILLRVYSSQSLITLFFPLLPVFIPVSLKHATIDRCFAISQNRLSDRTYLHAPVLSVYDHFVRFRIALQRLAIHFNRNKWF